MTKKKTTKPDEEQYCKMCARTSCRNEDHNKGPNGEPMSEMMGHFVTMCDGDRVISGWYDKAGFQWCHQVMMVDLGWFNPYKAMDLEITIRKNKVDKPSCKLVKIGAKLPEPKKVIRTLKNGKWGKWTNERNSAK